MSMPDDWGTVNLTREKAVGREIEQLRERYLHHMATLEKLIIDAPTDHLAGEYERVRQDVEISLQKLNELENGVPVPRPSMSPVPAPVAPAQSGPKRREDDPFYQTNPRVLVQRDSPVRALAIVLVGFVVVALAGYFFWKYVQGKRAGRSNPAISTATSALPEETATVKEIAPPPASTGFTISPPSQDFGRIRRGTRATRQFELTNNTDAEIPLAVSRSSCKCLWFEYVALPPGGSTTLTVTIDAARAPKGTLRETVKVSSKTNASLNENLEVTAVIH